MNDYATLARIEDHLRRQAEASERIADALERAHTAYMDIEASNQPAKPCDDRTCTDRDHWAPTGRINHGSTPTTCIHGQDHPDSLTCEYRCAATMPGHWCTRREHADDRHVWAMSDEEYDRRREEAGVPRDVFDDVRAWADGREAAQRRLTVTVDARSLETGEPVPVSVTVRKVADPLDEDDHRPRHFPDGEHLRRYACGHWHMATRDRCNDPDHGDSHTLAWWDEPLTFCDCDDATIEAENGATD